MSQNEVEEEVNEEVATDSEDNQEEDTTSDEEISYEQALKWKKDSESLQKANKKIAMLEKEKKEPKETKEVNLSEEALEALMEKREFYKDNSLAKELRSEIEAMVSASNGKVSRDKAFAVLS